MFIERKNEFDTLLSLHRDAVKGRGAIALVRGEAGIGKTSLISALRERIGGDQPIYWGACEALSTPRPLGPLYDMVSAFPDKIVDLLENGASPNDLFSAIAKQLEEDARGAVFVIEDIHWADFATLDLLKYLGRRISAIAMLMVVSFRHDEVVDNQRLNKVLGDFPAALTTKMTLQPFSKSGVRKLCAAAGEKDRSAEYYEVSGGNPFFVNELLASEENPGDSLPASIKDAVNTRLLRLSALEREFLETLSLLPGSIPKKILQPLFGDQGELFSMAALGRKLLVEAGSSDLRFRHELARLSTMARVPPTRQREIHAQILKALLDANEFSPAFDALVHHAAGALDATMVLKYAPMAAETAAAIGAHQEAAAHLSTAMKFVDDAEIEQAAEIYEKWAYEAGLSLRIDDEVLDARRHAITLWRALGRKDRVADNLRWLSRLHWYRAESAEATRYADEAVRILEDAPPSAERAMGYSLKSQLFMLSDRMEDAVEWGEKALKLADQFDATEIRVHALNNVGVARAFRNDRTGVDMLEKSLAISMENGFHEHAARVYTNLSEYGVEFKEFDLAERVIMEGIAFDTRNDLDSWTHYLVGRQAQLRCEQGRLYDARAIAEGVLQLERQTKLMKLPSRLVLAKVKTLFGDDNANQVLGNATDHASATEEPQHIVPAHLTRLLYAWLNNQPRMAEESLYAVFDIGAEVMHLWHRGDVVIWGKRFGYQVPEEFLVDLPAPMRLEINGDIAGAAAKWKKLGAPVSHALALSQSAEPKLLAQAIEITQDIGAAAIEKTVLQRAKSIGVDDKLPNRRRGPYKASRNHPLGLTQKEQTVLSLLVEGRSNPEIADITSRSKRTIENHVSSILRKLNVENRMDATILVQSEPWLLPNGDKSSGA